MEVELPIITMKNLSLLCFPLFSITIVLKLDMFLSKMTKMTVLIKYQRQEILKKSENLSIIYLI